MRIIKSTLEYVSLFPLTLLTSGLLFISNGDNLLFMRTEGVVWASSHWLSQFAVVACAWSIISLDKFRGIFLNVLMMFNLGSLHEILFARLYYVTNLGIFLGTWFTFSISLVGLVFMFLYGKRWQKSALIVSALFFPIFFFTWAYQFQPTVLLSGGFNLPWAGQFLSNLSEIASWIIPCGIVIAMRLHETIHH